MKADRWIWIFLGTAALFIVSCHSGPKGRHTRKQTEAASGREKKGGGSHAAADTTKPVVIYSQNLADRITDNDFIVRVYPTAQEDEFRLEIRYGGNRATDQVSMLPPDYYKKIELRKGAMPGQCILGFVDNEGKFNQMTLITASSTRISIRKLKEYYLSNQ